MAGKDLTKEGKIELTLLMIVVTPLLVFLIAMCLWIISMPVDRTGLIICIFFISISLICLTLLFYYYYSSLKKPSADETINWKVVGLTILAIISLVSGNLLIAGSFMVSGMSEVDMSPIPQVCCISGLFLGLIGLYLLIYLNKHFVRENTSPPDNSQMDAPPKPL